MTRGYTQRLSSRGVQILRALAVAGDDGLTLAQVLGELGESGQHARARNVTMLKTMRDADRVAYAAGAAANIAGRGRPCGVYRLSAAGAAWLRGLGFYPGEERMAQGPEAVLETGSMRGEAPAVTHVQARPGQAPAGAPNWVFSLGAQL